MILGYSWLHQFITFDSIFNFLILIDFWIFIKLSSNFRCRPFRNSNRIGSLSWTVILVYRIIQFSRKVTSEGDGLSQAKDLRRVVRQIIGQIIARAFQVLCQQLLQSPPGLVHQLFQPSFDFFRERHRIFQRHHLACKFQIWRLWVGLGFVQLFYRFH